MLRVYKISLLEGAVRRRSKAKMVQSLCVKQGFIAIAALLLQLRFMKQRSSFGGDEVGLAMGA